MSYNHGILLYWHPAIRTVLQVIAKSPLPVGLSDIIAATASQLTYAEVVKAVCAISDYKMVHVTRVYIQGRKIKQYGPVYPNIERMLDKYTNVEVQP